MNGLNPSGGTPGTGYFHTRFQASVVQRLDRAILWLNPYPVDSAINFPNTYPLDSDLSGG